jgi:oligoribonuclease (3'-5' exoribonuclease)
MAASKDVLELIEINKKQWLSYAEKLICRSGFSLNDKEFLLKNMPAIDGLSLDVESVKKDCRI